MSLTKKIVVLAGDTVLLWASLALMLVIRYGADAFLQPFAVHRGPFSFIFLLWIITFYVSDLYRPAAFRTRRRIVTTVAITTVVATLVAMIAFYLFTSWFELTPRTNLFILAGVFCILDALWRSFVAKRFSFGAERVCLIGSSPLGDELTTYLTTNAHSGYRIVATVLNPAEKTEADIAETIERETVTTIVIHPTAAELPHIASLAYRLLAKGIRAFPFADFYERVFERIPLNEIDRVWFITNIVPRRRMYDAAKRAADFILALALTVICTPLTILVAILIRTTSRGPVLFIQERVGWRGTLFQVYKFRTMKDTPGGPLWTETNDARITPVGRILRFTHLDELPQLWNIVRGDIAFVGPRPERAELVKTFMQFPYYDIRHVVKPGLTGWAQINYRPSASLEEAHEKLTYDLFYVKNRSVVLDIAIILKTIKHLIAPLR